jgi:peptidoglycan hydrolase-like protein with peptidoglycan-binding domain
MRRMLVLGGFLALAAAAAGGAFLAVSRGSGEPAAATAATHRAHHDRGVSAAYRHHHGHTSAPVRPFGYPRMHFHKVSEGSHGKNVLRLQQLLARRGYLPVTFHAFGPKPMYTLAPRHGRFQWRFDAPPELRAQWQPGVFSTITRGAVMSFQADHDLSIDGIAGPDVWRALTGPQPFTKVPYTYALVRESSPETITVYQTGRATFTSLANTGIPAAPTALGTYPVYLRYTSTTMQGTEPDGTHYFDTGVPWVSYFNGGDAVHGFQRGSYGSPQSLGCVELPYDAAETAYNLMNYGTLVTVTS